MTEATSSQYTAAQIAEKLGKSPRVVRRWLSTVNPDGEMMVRNKITSWWKLDSLPAHCARELNTVAKARGYKTVEAFLSGRCDDGDWHPGIDWSEVCAEQQTEALALKRALLPLIKRRHDATLLVAEFETLGVESYQRETGQEISRERWRYLFDRTVQRDNGAEQFRNDIFLSGNLRRAVRKEPAPDDLKDFKPLSDYIARLRNRNADEIDALWSEAIELYQELSEQQNPKKLKRRLIDFLFARAPFLSTSRNSLRSCFDGKLSGRIPLLDGRRAKLGEKRAPEIPQADKDTATRYVLDNCGDRTTQGLRELGDLGDRSGLSNATLELAQSRNRRLYDAVNQDVKLVANQKLGKKARRDATPSHRRNYSKLHSMDVLTADDFTMPVYMFVPDGKGWWTLTRGQCLLMIDVRSRKIIAFSLQPERSYNSLVIRTLMNQTCRAWGLPHVWYFENGIWRNASLVKAAPREWSEGKSWGELKPGWERLGVKFMHAKSPQAKPAEGVGAALQDLMEGVPGYCGREERHDCPERTIKNKLAVEAARVAPNSLDTDGKPRFLSFDGWYQKLGELVKTYNNSVQPRSRILRGMTPEQAFEAHWPHGKEPVKFDASCWHLLAHYVSQRKVGVEGITFRIGNQPYVYRDENSSNLRGREVLAWFDPECPELLGVTDLKGRDPRLIQCSHEVDFLAFADGPESESARQFREEQKKIEGHNSYPKARFNVLVSKFHPRWRENCDVSLNTALVATAFENGRVAVQEKQRQKTERTDKRLNKILKLGLKPITVRDGGELVDDGLDMMDRAEREEKQAKKTYDLNPHKTFIPKPKGDSQ